MAPLPSGWPLFPQLVSGCPFSPLGVPSPSSWPLLQPGTPPQGPHRTGQDGCHVSWGPSVMQVQMGQSTEAPDHPWPLATAPGTPHPPGPCTPGLRVSPSGRRRRGRCRSWWGRWHPAAAEPSPSSCHPGGTSTTRSPLDPQSPSLAAHVLGDKAEGSNPLLSSKGEGQRPHELTPRRQQHQLCSR